MGLFDKFREPIFLKEESDAEQHLEQLYSYMSNASSEIKTQIEQDIRMLKYGLQGEDNIKFELKNSHIPMYILHDIFYEYNGLTTQIDYIVITRKIVIIIECKNLFGNITIDGQGNFIRTIKTEKGYQKKGIYSPVTQNQRHLDMIHEIRRASKHLLLRTAFDKNFSETYKSVVVLANPNSILNLEKAPKEIKRTVIKADRLISHIKDLNEKSKALTMSDKEMLELANFFLDNSVQNKKDYTEKYRININAELTEQNSINPDSESLIPDNLEETAVYQELKAYRFKKSKEENVKAYYIYNNAQMEAIIKASPKTIDELKSINGFGDVKCSKYGQDILDDSIPKFV